MPSIDQKWRAKSDLQTMREAEEIKADRVRVVAARREAKKQMSELSKITRQDAPIGRAARDKRLSGRKL